MESGFFIEESMPRLTPHCRVLTPGEFNGMTRLTESFMIVVIRNVAMV